MTNTTNELMCVFNDKKVGDMYASFSPDTMEGKIKLYNAINSPDARIADNINKQIRVKDVVIKAVKLAEERRRDNGGWVDEDSATASRDGFRVIIIDDEGKAYSATSNGIYNSMCTIRAVFGQLHFDEPLTVEVAQIKTKNGNTLTLKVIS